MLYHTSLKLNIVNSSRAWLRDSSKIIEVLTVCSDTQLQNADPSWLMPWMGAGQSSAGGMGAKPSEFFSTRFELQKLVLQNFFWKHVTHYYVIKNYNIGPKLAIFNVAFYSIVFIVNPIMRHETQAWCDVTLRRTSRQQKRVPEIKRSIHCLFCIILIRVDTILSKNIAIIFKIYFPKSCSPSQPNKQIYFGNFNRLQRYICYAKPSGECYAIPLSVS